METTVKSSGNSSKKTQIIASLLTVAVLVIVFGNILPKLGNYGSAIDEIKSMQQYQVLALLLFTVVNVLVYVFPYMAALPKLKYLPGFVLRQTSFLISNSVPGGGAFGVGVQASMLKDYGFSGSETSSGIVLTSVWNLLSTVSLPGFAALVLLLTGQLDGDSAVKAITGLAIAVVSLGTFYIIIKSKNIAATIGKALNLFVSRVLKIIRIKKAVNIDKLVSEFRDVAYKVTVERWHLLAVSNLAQQLSQFSVLFVALLILGVGEGTFATILWSYALARLGSFIPLTPGGIGTVDALLVGMLIQTGVPSEVALASTLIWRFATFIPQIFIGSVTFIYWRIKKNYT